MVAYGCVGLVVETIDGGLVAAWHQVAVRVHRDADAVLPHLVLHVSQTVALGDQEARRRDHIVVVVLLVVVVVVVVVFSRARSSATQFVTSVSKASELPVGAQPVGSFASS